MSFCIDLWNGVNIIKDKYTNMRRELRSFANFLTKYNTYELQHCKNLDSLFNEFKEQKTQKNITNFDKARNNLVEMINYESQTKKTFLDEVLKIVKKINIFLQDLKNPSNEISDLTDNFDKEIDKLNSKKEMFFTQCKEISSLLSQFELENKLNDKNSEQKISKVLNKLIKTRDDYLLSINETNIKRNTYNKKVEELLDKYELEHRNLLKCCFECLNEFKTKKYELANDINKKERSDFLNIFNKLKEDEEVTEFIINNATKEFPMVQIEFCPFKKKDFETFLNSKYHNKLKKNDLNKIMTTIKNYFQNNNIFPLNFIQTGINRVVKQQRESFFSARLSIFQKGNSNENKEITRDKNSKDKEINIIKNYELIKNIVNELVTDNKIKIFESKYVIEGDISKLLEEQNKPKNINDKIKELKLLIDEKNESHLVYIEALIKTLSYIRSKGCFEIKEETFNIITDIFKTILEQNMNDDYILKNILILAQTFYKIENKVKIYLHEGIKGNKVLNSPKTWHRCINYSMKLANKDLIVNNNKEYIEKIDKEAYATVITYLCDLKAFTDDEEVYKAVSYFYIKLYNLKEEDIKETVEKSIKSRQNKKEKEDKKEKNEINEIKLVNKENKNEIKEINKDENKNEIIINDNKINNEINNEKNKIEEKNNKKK